MIVLLEKSEELSDLVNGLHKKEKFTYRARIDSPGN